MDIEEAMRCRQPTHHCRCAPGSVALPGVAQQRPAGIIETTGQIKPSRALGNQRVVPGACLCIAALQRQVKGPDCGRCRSRRPSRFRLDEVQQVPEIGGRVRRALGEPVAQRVELGGKRAALLITG